MAVRRGMGPTALGRRRAAIRKKGGMVAGYTRKDGTKVKGYKRLNNTILKDRSKYKVVDGETKSFYVDKKTGKFVKSFKKPGW